MNFLLDTNVISEPRRKRAEPRVVSWFKGVERTSLYISVVTLGELAHGTARIERRDAAQAAALRAWLDATQLSYRSRVIPVDPDIAKVWGELNARRPLPVIDGLLAATALVRGLTFVTRDTRDLADTGVSTVNPWLE